MTFSVLVRVSARQDIDSAQGWYREHAPEQVARFFEQLAVGVDRVRNNPHAFRVLRQDVRRAVLRVFPYSLWYRTHDEARIVELLALVHERQDPERLTSRYL